MKQTFIEKMTGYKATNADMKCRDVQFKLGEWQEIEGELKMCERGFHFCMHPSGVWNYYNDLTVRVFKCEAEQVLECPIEAGADFKLVAKRIRLIKEITPGKRGNDKSNTGDRNTGNRNTGDSNTGYRNTGDRNTGDSNTGYRNTGNRNTGDRNTGDSNTGDSNTGDRNTGYSNTGYRNTGDRNTGDSNTGNSNATNYSAGFFCIEEPKVISFDVQTDLTHEEYQNKYPVYELGQLLLQKEKIDFDKFKHIPGITAKKLEVLHEKHLKGRKL